MSLGRFLCNYYTTLLEYEHGIMIFFVVDTNGLSRVRFTGQHFENLATPCVVLVTVSSHYLPCKLVLLTKVHQLSMRALCKLHKAVTWSRFCNLSKGGLLCFVIVISVRTYSFIYIPQEDEYAIGG